MKHHLFLIELYGDVDDITTAWEKAVRRGGMRSRSRPPTLCCYRVTRGTRLTKLGKHPNEGNV